MGLPGCLRDLYAHIFPAAHRREIISSGAHPDVIIALLKNSLAPCERFAFVFHVSALALVALIIVFKERMGKWFGIYSGLNLILIAFAQSFGETEEFGSVIHTGGLAGFVILGILWLRAAARGEIQTRFRGIGWQHALLLPFAVLAYWAPYKLEGEAVRAYFHPLLLLTSVDFGLAFCFTAPVLLYLLTFFYPHVPMFAYRMTAFNGLLYALFNLSYWLDPRTRWMGVLHLPLLVISVYALAQTAGRRQRSDSSSGLRSGPD